MADLNRLDIIIFGASGYTGKYVVKNLASLAKEYNLKWGVSGRSLSSLQAALKWASEKTGDDLSDIPTVLADIQDESSIEAMTRKCRIVLNCVGPYTWYGEIVVKACVESKTHHVDITGEPYFMEKMQLEYNEKAKAAGSLIVSACGIELLPTDCGILKLQDIFGGQVNSVDCYISLYHSGPNPQKGPMLNTGTWHSAILLGKMEGKRKEIQAKLYPAGFKQCEPIPPPPCGVPKFGTRYCVESPGPDFSVVSRTQQTLYTLQGRRPASFRSYFLMSSWLLAYLINFFTPVFFALTQYNFFCYLLSKFPKIFSLGNVNSGGPIEEELKHSKAKITIRAEGWESDNNQTRKVKELTLKCTDPAYNTTSLIMILAGVTLLKQSHLLPAKGGVFTPGALFYRTSIIEDLKEKRVLDFEFSDENKSSPHEVKKKGE